MNERGPVALVICGPTASGKTALAVDVCRCLGGEIISVDSRQVYRGMDIGSGKDRHEYTRDGVETRVHLIDVTDAGDEYNLFLFLRDFNAAFHEVRSRGRLPVLCGGTGLYLSAVLEGYELVEAPVNMRLRAELSGLDLPELVRRLESSGRKLHNVTDTIDRERAIRALEIEAARGGPTLKAPSFDYLAFLITIEPVELHRRIAARLRSRIGQGLIDEVRGLLKKGVGLERLYAYGLEYRQVARYLAGGLSFEEAMEELERDIRRFAARQRRWFRRMATRGVSFINLDGAIPREKLLKQVTEAWRTRFP